VHVAGHDLPAGCIVAEAAIQSPSLVIVLLDLQAHAASVLDSQGGSAGARVSQPAGGGAHDDGDDDDEVVILEERSGAAAAESQGGDEAGPARKRRRMQPRSLRQTQLPCEYCCYVLCQTVTDCTCCARGKRCGSKQYTLML
jgi:hypothetical protein